MSYRQSQRHRNSIRLDVHRWNDEEVIINVIVINDHLWRRSVNGTLTFRIIVDDLDTGGRDRQAYHSNQSFATNTIDVQHGSAYYFTCKVFSDTNYYHPLAKTSKYYHTYQDRIIQTGMPDILSMGEVELLKKTAVTIVRNENSQPFPATFLYRNNHPEYFEDIKQNKGNMMLVSPKNSSGDLRCPIVNNLRGIEFSVGSWNLLPRKSPFGDTRVVIPLERIIHINVCNLYAADLYCYGKGHHVLLVVTRSGSPADIFCAQRLPQLPWIPSNPYENPFLFFDTQAGTFYVTFSVWISVFYTENVRIDQATDFFKCGFGKRNSRVRKTQRAIMYNV